MRSRSRTRADELGQIPFACFKRRVVQPSAKQLIPQPNAIGVDHVSLTVVRDFLDPPFAKVSFDIRAREAVRLSWKPHGPTQLIECDLRLRAERRQHIAKV